jgi:SAM-dependent methyltransferase
MAEAQALDRFRAGYAEQRASEGRAHRGADLASLPYLKGGPLAREWAVRTRSFDAFVKHVVNPATRRRGRPLEVLDLGAGNGWLCHRLAVEGHRCTAVDIRDDEVDGLGAAAELSRLAHFERVQAPFERLPLPGDSADVAVFNASLHYAMDLAAVMAEAARTVRSGGCIAILDSPFYPREADGEAMVREKHARGSAMFGERAATLLALPFIEFLTRDRLRQASGDLGLAWRRQRVRYPLWYELRPVTARLHGRRPPSRFDLWLADVR